jgi:hypothetical protein
MGIVRFKMRIGVILLRIHSFVNKQHATVTIVAELRPVIHGHFVLAKLQVDSRNQNVLALPVRSDL